MGELAALAERAKRFSLVDLERETGLSRRTVYQLRDQIKTDARLSTFNAFKAGVEALEAANPISEEVITC